MDNSPVLVVLVSLLFNHCPVFFSFFLVDQKKIVQSQGIFGQSLGIFGWPKKNLSSLREFLVSLWIFLVKLWFFFVHPLICKFLPKKNHFCCPMLDTSGKMWHLGNFGFFWQCSTLIACPSVIKAFWGICALNVFLDIILCICQISSQKSHFQM